MQDNSTNKVFAWHQLHSKSYQKFINRPEVKRASFINVLLICVNPNYLIYPVQLAKSLSSLQKSSSGKH